MSDVAFKNKALFGNLLPGSLVSLSDLVDPGNEAFEKPLLRVSIKEGIVEDHLHEIGLGDQFRNSKSGVKKMAFEDLQPAKGYSAKKKTKKAKTERLSEKFLAEVRALMAEGKKQNEIARILGIPYSKADYYVRKARILGKTESMLAPGPEVKPEPADIKLAEPKVELTPEVSVAPKPFVSKLSINENPKIVSITDLRKTWADVHQHDQAQAALAARILKFLAVLSEDFQDDPQLADEVANCGTEALIRRYRQMVEERMIP